MADTPQLLNPLTQLLVSLLSLCYCLSKTVRHEGRQYEMVSLCNQFFMDRGGQLFYSLHCSEQKFFKKMLAGADKGLVSVLPITIGALLIVGAYQTAFPWVVVLLGILAAVKGCIFLFNPEKLADKLTSWYLEQASDHTYRLAGIIAIILGTALLSWL